MYFAHKGSRIYYHLFSLLRSFKHFMEITSQCIYCQVKFIYLTHLHILHNQRPFQLGFLPNWQWHLSFVERFASYQKVCGYFATSAANKLLLTMWIWFLIQSFHSLLLTFWEGIWVIKNFSCKITLISVLFPFWTNIKITTRLLILMVRWLSQIIQLIHILVFFSIYFYLVQIIRL